jgi:hypothetical protein
MTPRKKTNKLIMGAIHRFKANNPHIMDNALQPMQQGRKNQNYLHYSNISTSTMYNSPANKPTFLQDIIVHKNHNNVFTHLKYITSYGQNMPIEPCIYCKTQPPHTIDHCLNSCEYTGTTDKKLELIEQATKQNIQIPSPISLHILTTILGGQGWTNSPEQRHTQVYVLKVLQTSPMLNWAKPT